VLLGKGNGTFQRAVDYSTGSYPQSVAVADFNGDGKPDLAVSNVNGTVSVLLGNGDGAFQAAVNYGAGIFPDFVAVGDFDGDGKPDLAVVNQGSDGDGGVSVLLNTSACIGVGLAVVRSNSVVTISWPFPSTRFVLESTTNLSASNWQLAAETPTTNNGRVEVSLQLDQQQRYFRLRKQ